MPLYKEIVIDIVNEIEKASIIVSGMTGDTRIKGSSVIFKPRRAYMPNTWYDVKAEIYKNGNKGEFYFSFKTLDLGEKMWVEIDLSEMNRVIIYKGKRPIRIMLASGGIPGGEYETPKGIFTVGDKGERFFTHKFGRMWIILG